MKIQLPDDVLAVVDRWAPKQARLLDELWEDAVTELQRELLARAIVAGHTPAEIHAFADEIRPLDDDTLYERCTPDAAKTPGATVAQLLRAEGDPLSAYELNVGELEPNEPSEVSEVSISAVNPQRFGGDAIALAKAALGSKGFLGESKDARPVPKPPGTPPLANKWAEGSSASSPRLQPLDWGEPGGGRSSARSKALEWDDGGSVPHSAALAAGPASLLLEDVVNDATRAFGLRWQEHEVDSGGGLTLEKALSSAAQASAQGLPVPVAVGPQVGQSRRLALLLQTSTSGKSRAWQLFDPFTQELVWANEGDLLARAELPFADKRNRRITRVALPSWG